MDPVLFILFAGIGHDLGILAFNGQSDGPGLAIKLGVLEGDCPLDIVLVDLLKTLDQMQLIAMLVAGSIEPGAIVKPDGSRFAAASGDIRAHHSGVAEADVAAPARGAPRQGHSPRRKARKKYSARPATSNTMA